MEARGESKPVLLVETGKYSVSNDQLTLTPETISYNLEGCSPQARKTLLEQQKEYQKQIGKRLSGQVLLTAKTLSFAGKDSSNREVRIDLVR
jgi:hypothetical protein